jgi:hypothetical protein
MELRQVYTLFRGLLPDHASPASPPPHLPLAAYRRRRTARDARHLEQRDKKLTLPEGRLSLVLGSDHHGPYGYTANPGVWC